MGYFPRTPDSIIGSFSVMQPDGKWGPAKPFVIDPSAPPNPFVTVTCEPDCKVTMSIGEDGDPDRDLE